MESIAFEDEKGKGFSGRMRRFFSRFQIGGILRECNAYKERGIPALTVLAYLFSDGIGLPLFSGVQGSESVSGYAVEKSAGILQRHRVPFSQQRENQLAPLCHNLELPHLSYGDKTSDG